MLDDNKYEDRLDKIFAKGSMWEYRTFRTIFDPLSSEWDKTSFDKKIEILKKVVEAGEDLEFLISEYKECYNQKKRTDISNSVESAITQLLEYTLTPPKHD